MEPHCAERRRGVFRQAGRHSTVLPFSRGLFDAALALYEERLDKKYSLTDCASMVVMRDRRISHVLTNDHHFEQEGFNIVSA
jgi:predicted nucleic acid-binding protein